MDALLMAGGRGSRFDTDEEKPMVDVGGEPMVERVLSAVEGSSSVDRVVGVTSPLAPDTRDHLLERIDVVDADGEGYVQDLEAALQEVDGPALTVAADLPLLSSEAVEEVAGEQVSGSLAVYVPRKLKRSLGASVDEEKRLGARPVCPSGLNVVGGRGEASMVVCDASLAVNVNTIGDLDLARALVDSGGLR